MGFRQFLNENNKDVVVMFDLDGVLANFEKKLLGANPQWVSAELEGMPDDEFWPAVMAIPNFWESLEPIQAGLKLLRWCDANGYDCQILSSPSRSDKRSIPGKHKWIKKHLSGFNISKVNLVRARNKQDFAKPNVVLVDDMDKNVSQFKSRGGQIVHFNQNDKGALDKLKKVIATISKETV
jgi:hypothetical protein